MGGQGEVWYGRWEEEEGWEDEGRGGMVGGRRGKESSPG